MSRIVALVAVDRAKHGESLLLQSLVRQHGLRVPHQLRSTSISLRPPVLEPRSLPFHGDCNSEIVTVGNDPTAKRKQCEGASQLTIQWHEHDGAGRDWRREPKCGPFSTFSRELSCSTPGVCFPTRLSRTKLSTGGLMVLQGGRCGRRCSIRCRRFCMTWTMACAPSPSSSRTCPSLPTASVMRESTPAPPPLYHQICASTAAG